MTDRRAEIAERHGRATPGPYESVPPIEGSEWRVINGPPQVIQDVMLSRRAFTRIEDAAFLAHSWSDVQWLLSELTRLTAEAEAQRDRFAEREAIYKDQIATGGRVIDELRAEVATLTADLERMREAADKLTEAVGWVLTWAHKVEGVAVIRRDHFDRLSPANTAVRALAAAARTETPVTDGVAHP